MDYNSIQAVVTPIVSQPTPYFSAQLLVAAQVANGGVKNTFFGSVNASVYKQLASNSMLQSRAAGTNGPLSNFALYYTSYVMSTNSLYGFNSTIQNTNFASVQTQIKNLSSAGTGDAMFLDYLLTQGLTPAFADQSSMQNSAVAIAQNLGSANAFNMLITQLQHSSSSTSIFPAKVFLYLLNILDNGGNNFKQVIDAWQTSKNNWSLVADWNQINWFDTLDVDFNQNASSYNVVNQAVSNAINQASTVTNYKTYCPPCMGGPAPICPRCEQEENGTTSTYGIGVVNWLNSSTGPSALGLRSGNGPNNVVTTGGGGGGGGCLLHDTNLLTADGKWIKVQDVKPGMRLLNGKKEVVIATCETVVNPRVAAVYGINSETPMMSKEHAVMTQRGWCSLQPNESMKLNPHIRVGYLKEGDLVWRIQTSSDGTSKIVLEEVKKIVHQELKKGKEQTGYAFTFSNGSRSLWANGYCTLVNYPELTAERLSHQLKDHLSASDEVQLSIGMKNAGPILEKAMGYQAYHGIMELFKTIPTMSKSKTILPVRDLNNLVLPKMEVVIEDPSSSLKAKELAIINGQLFMDGKLMNSKIQDQRLYWSGQDESGISQHGVLRFSPDRSSAHGMVHSNGITAPISAYTEIDYHTSYGPTNKPWYNFEMGFQINDKGQKVMYGTLLQDDGTAFDSDTVTITFSPATNKDHQILMQADIEFNPTWVAWTQFPWIAATFLFSNDYRSFVGTVYQYNANQPQNRGQGFTLNGVYNQINDLLQKEHQLKERQLLAPIDLSTLQTGTSVDEKDDIFSIASNLQDEDHLSVEALYSLAPPDMVQLNQTNFDTLKNLMVYSVPDDLLQWFNETRPSVGPGQPLSQKEADLVQQHDVQSFLNDRFAMGYLSQAFSQADDPKIKSFYNGIPDWQNKLAYFWQGKGDGCFATDPGYNTATSTIMNTNYIAAVPGLAPYLADNPKSWASQLYSYCTQTDVINTIAAGNAGLLNNLVMMLQALDSDKVVPIPSGDTTTYGAALYRAVLNVRLGIMKANPKLSSQDSPLTDWLNAFLRQYFQMAQDGYSGWDNETLTAIQQSLDEALKEYNVSSLNALENHWGDLIAGVINVLNESQNLPLTQSIANWAEQNPGKARIFGAAVSFAVFGVATFALVDAALNWDEMSAAEKTQAIVDAAASIAVLFDKYAQYKNALILTDANAGSEKIKAAIELTQTNQEMSTTVTLDRVVEGNPRLAEGLEDAMLSNVGRNGASAISAAGNVEDGTAMWTKVANISGKFAEFMGVLAIGVACWATGMQIADDFASGQPLAVKALDILEEAANATCFVIGAGVGIAGLLSVEVASFIPVIGAVVAIVGIIISIISLFVHRNPPESPAESFVEDSIVPWIKALVTPPTEWVANYEKAQQHLDPSTTG